MGKGVFRNWIRNILVMHHFRVIYHAISYLYFLGIHTYKWQVGYSMQCQKGALYNYFIRCRRKYSGKHSDGKVECTRVE